MTSQKLPKSPKRGGPVARSDAMRLLAEGYQVGAVARMLGVDRRTVRDWRDSPTGQAELDKARKAREAQLAEGRDAALRILREAAPLAAQRLVDALAAPPPASVGAAEAILARVGLPRSSKIEATVEPGVDLSKLSDDEIATLEALHAKARG
jgi:transposase